MAGLLRSRWPLVAAGFLCLFLIGLVFALPVYRSANGIRVLDNAVWLVTTSYVDWPYFLVDWAGRRNLRYLEDVSVVRDDGRLSPARLEECLAQLSAFKELRALTVVVNAISDADLERLASLKKLEFLSIRSPQVTDRGLQSLSGCLQLNQLELAGCSVSDDGLIIVGKLHGLTGLVLDSTTVTDAGLVHLRGLKSLKSLSVSDTQVTPEGLDSLRAALPNLEVFDD